FPLVNSHPNAFPAARAAEAAGRQGKFWEMHDLLYDRQESWSTERNAKDTFVSYAEELELDMDKFKNDYESSDVENSISYDMVLGNKTGVSYTPTFVINGAIVRLPGSV